MWDIVTWTDEDAIDYVPSVWANQDNTKYKYPIGLSETKIREIIYDCKDVTTNFQWCNAQLRKRQIKNLHRAKAFCEKGLYTSNLDTSDDEDHIARKKTRRPIETEYLRNMQQDDVDDSEVDDAIRFRKNFNVPKTSIPTTATRVDARESPISCNSSNNLSVDLLHAIIKNQLEIKFEIKELRNKIESIENRQISTNGNSSVHPESVFVHKLPAKNVDEVNELENLIVDDQLFKELLCALYLVGGSTLTATVNGIMKKMLEPQVAVLYSGVGKKHKLPFCHLKLYKVVLGAIRKRHPSATDEEVQKTVSIFLAQSQSRLSRSARNTTTIVTEDVL